MVAIIFQFIHTAVLNALKSILQKQINSFQESRHIVPDPEEVGGTRSATAAIEQAEKESKKRGNK